MISLPTIISNYIQFNFWGIAMNILLTRRYSRLKTFLLLQLIILGMIFFPYILPYLSTWRAMIGLITWAAPLVLYSDKIRKKLVVFALCTVTTMFVELWVAVLLPPEVVAAGVSAQTTELQFGIYAVYDASTALLLAVGTLFLKRFDLKNEQYLTLRHWLGFSLFPISQYVLLCGWFSELALEDFSLSKLIFMVIAELICMVSDAVLYMSMVSIARRSRLAAENELLKKQIDAQKAHYAALTDQYEDIRRMRHDIANHMYTINLLLKDGRTEEAAAYAKELNEKTEFQPMLGQCRNPITDAFLYSRSKELEAQGVDVNMNVNVPRIPKVSNIHMVSALGNLLDNAAEAALKCEKPWIKLNAYSSKGYLIIEVTNPTLPNASKPRRIPELPRGVGSHILTEIAEAYEGQYTCCEENGIFHATLTLKEDNCDASHSDM